MNKSLLCFRTFLGFFLVLFFNFTLRAQPVNDICEDAIELNVVSDMGFTCMPGNNLLAQPELFNNNCSIGDFPTVWYKVDTDGFAALMNIHVKNAEFESPTISLFHLVSDCTALQPVGMTLNNFPCIYGSAGEAEAMGTEVGASEVYYIAVSSLNHQGGSFDICVSVMSEASLCVVRREIEIVSRSETGPLEGPFFPGETVHICMNVQEYTAVGNGCQWFQGIIPVFGNGWDPASFDADGQPLNATVNGNNMGVLNNGNYGTARWDWFTDVGYHYTDQAKQIGDFDGNGTLDMCNRLYESDCPDWGGIEGGCCGPCWDNSQGQTLPGGWFAYGINGSCETPGPPIRVDWGDGNTCGAGMGPWKFCFDLQTREYPQCLQDPSTVDLSLKFFTTADGETGSWTGNASVCGLDQPAKLTLPYCCCDVSGFQESFTKNNNELFQYALIEEGVDYYTWSVSPTPVQGAYEGQAFHGEGIKNVLYNPTQQTQKVTYNLTGYRGACTVYTNTLEVNVFCSISTHFESQSVCSQSPATLSPIISGCNQDLSYAWSPGGDTTASITINQPVDGTEYCVTVTNGLNGEVSISCVLLDVYDEVEVSIEGADTSCVNTSQITASPLNGSEPFNVDWFFPDSTVQHESTIHPQIPGMYVSQITDAAGCRGLDSIEVTLHELPVITIGTAGDQTFCIEDTTILVAHISTGASPYTVSWLASDSVFISDTLIAVNAGTYEARVIDANGCESSPASIELWSPPLLDLGADTIQIAGSFILDAGPNAEHYIWNTGDTTRLVEITGTGLYSVTITDVNGCTNSDVQYVEILTGIIPIGKTQVVSVFPNPTNGLINLRIAGTLDKNAGVSLYALDGKQVYRDEYQSGLQEKILQLEHLAEGIYFIRVDIGADIYWGKIVVQ